MISHGWLSSGQNVELVKVLWIPTAVSRHAGSPRAQLLKWVCRWNLWQDWLAKLEASARVELKHSGSHLFFLQWLKNHNICDRLQGFYSVSTPQTRWTNTTGPLSALKRNTAFSPQNYPRRQQGFLRSGKYITWSASRCPQKAHSDLLCSKSKIKGVIQRSPPTRCNKARGKSALRPSKLVLAMSWCVFEYWDVLSRGCFLPHRAKTDRMAHIQATGHNGLSLLPLWSQRVDRKNQWILHWIVMNIMKHTLLVVIANFSFYL